MAKERMQKSEMSPVSSLIVFALDLAEILADEDFDKGISKG
jgi:hypothetical protein